VPEGGAGETGTGGHRRDQDESQPEQAQGHALRADGEAEKKLQEQVEQLLAEAARVDAEEDQKYGKGQRGDALPAELARRESRLKKIRAAKAELEREAKQRAEQEKAAVEARWEERRRQEQEQGKRLGGRPPQAPDPEQAQPDGKAQRNFTDPDSRIMKDGASQSFVQGYNAQAADAERQIIVAASLTQQTNDKQPLVPMLERVQQTTGRWPETRRRRRAISAEPM